MANTFVLLASVEVGAGKASTISFTSIPQTYTDLLLVMSLRDDRSDAPVTDSRISFNATYGGTSYRLASAIGNNNNNPISVSSNSGFSSFTAYHNSGTSTSNTFSTNEIYIANYTSSNSKSLISWGGTENNSADNYTLLQSANWNNSAAINSIYITPWFNGLSYIQYSKASLYGIKDS